MVHFDPTSYKKEVLQRWSRGVERDALQNAVREFQVQSDQAYLALDLRSMFAVPSGATAEDLADLGRQLDLAYNKAKALPATRSLQQLKSILTERGSFADPTFWSGLSGQQQRARAAAIRAAASDLRAEAPLGVMSVSDAEAHLRALGLSFDQETEEALAREKLRVFGDIQLPAGDELRQVKFSWGKVQQHAEFRSILDVLTLGQPAVQQGEFLTALRVNGASVTLGNVRDALKVAQSKSDSAAVQDAQKFLGEVSRFRDVAALHRLVISAIQEKVEQQIAQRIPLPRVVSSLTQAGLAEYDVRCLVATLGATVGGSRALNADAVRAALADGDLERARATLDALPPVPETEAERTTLDREIIERSEQKRSALDAYRAAFARRDFGAARESLDQAFLVSRADPELAALAEALPVPAPPVAISVGPEGPVLTWPVVDQGATYRVFRSTDRPIADPPQGSALASNITQPSYVDNSAPAGEHVFYGVVAQRSGGALSPVGRADVIYLAEPSEVRVQAGADEVEVTWFAPPTAQRVTIEIIDESGRRSTVEVRGARAHRLRDLRSGTTYRLVLKAWYLLETGLASSPAVAVNATPRPAAQPIRDLYLDQNETGHTASWHQPTGFSAELWLLPRDQAGLAGRHVPAERLNRLGKPVVGAVVQGNDGRQALEMGPVAGVHLLYPCLVTDSGFLLGTPVAVGGAPVVGNPSLVFFSDQLQVTWDWPDIDCLVEVRWQSSQGWRSRRVTRNRYRLEGGVFIAQPHGISRLCVVTIARFGDEEWESPPVEVPVPQTGAPALTLSYSVTFVRRLAGRRADFTICADSPRPGPIEFAIVMRPGDLLPSGPDQGTELQRFSLDFGDDLRKSVAVELGRARSPFWVRLFIVSPRGLTLQDPNITQLKG